jgi:Tfp pilus assembly protein PilE
MNKHDHNHGFGIVELLVIVVVIGILATVAVNYYKSSTPVPTQTVKDVAVGAVLQTDLSNTATLLRIDQANSDTGSFPATLKLANSGKGIKTSEGVTLQYVVDNKSDPKTFCITATKNDTSYMIDNVSHTTAAEGACE